MSFNIHKIVYAKEDISIKCLDVVKHTCFRCWRHEFPQVVCFFTLETFKIVLNCFFEQSKVVTHKFWWEKKKNLYDMVIALIRYTYLYIACVKVGVHILINSVKDIRLHVVKLSNVPKLCTGKLTWL